MVRGTHSTRSNVTMLDGSRTEEMSQDKWADTPDSTRLTRIRRLAVVRSRLRMTKQIPCKVLHLDHKLREHWQAGEQAKIQAVRDHRDSLAEQLRTVMGRTEDVVRYCEEIYGVGFRVTTNVFELTVRRVTFSTGAGWIAVT